MFELTKMLSKEKSNLPIKKLNEVSELIPSADVLDFCGKLTEAYKEAKITEVEIAKVEAQKEILLTEIQNKYELYHKVFDRLFDERKLAIDKSFDIIDKGLKDNDKELISIGMQSLSKVVSSSPFANAQQLSNMLESNKVIEI